VSKFSVLDLYGFTIQRTTLYSHLLIRSTCFILLQVREPVDEVFEFYFKGKPKLIPNYRGLRAMHRRTLCYRHDDVISK